MKTKIEEGVKNLIRKLEMGTINRMCHINSGKMNHVFRVQLDNGQCIYAKHAGNVPRSAELGPTLRSISQIRLVTENKALKLLRSFAGIGVEVPEIIHFDEKTPILLMTEICPRGRLLEDELKDGNFDPIVARLAGEFLLKTYAASNGISPLWGKKELDLKHWKKMLSLRTVDIETGMLDENVSRSLQELYEKADMFCQNRLVTLDYCPKNILVSDSTIGIIDLELSSSFGDPAYDLGFFIGHYFFWGILTENANSLIKAVEEILTVYQKGSTRLWKNIYTRVIAFAGAAILYRILGESRMDVGNSKDRLLRTGICLLYESSLLSKTPNQIFKDAAFGRFD